MVLGPTEVHQQSREQCVTVDRVPLPPPLERVPAYTDCSPGQGSGAVLPSQTPAIEVGEVSSHVKVGLNQTALPALVKDALGNPPPTTAVRPALLAPLLAVGETSTLPRASHISQKSGVKKHTTGAKQRANTPKVSNGTKTFSGTIHMVHLFGTSDTGHS